MTATTTNQAAQAANTCVIDGCSKPAKRLRRTICEAHYYRHRRTGEYGTAPVQEKNPGGDCSIPGCTKTKDTRGWCHAHYSQWRRTGDPETITPYKDRAWPRGEANNKWKGDDIGYGAAHDRNRRTRGPATQHPCTDCGEPAHHWSLDHESPNTRTDPGTGLAYSPRPDDYRPRCAPCHKRYDLSINPYTRSSKQGRGV